MKVITRELSKDIKNLTIIPLSDVHIGDKQADLKQFKAILERIKNEPNTYTILNGDLCNVALKNSKSDVYSDELTPNEQVLKIIEYLDPIKDKILVMSSGNHEARIQKDTSIDVLRMVAKALQIEQVYSNSWWYLFLSFGENEKQRKQQYTLTGYHGSGGGRKSGGKINRLEEMSQVVLADVYIMSHTHKPIQTKGIIYTPDISHKRVYKRELYYVNSNAFVDYDGSYAEAMGMIPSHTGITEIELEAKKKKITLKL